MKRSFELVAGIALLISVFPNRGADFKLGGQTFTLPEGFTIEKVAGPGLVDRPIEADFDEQGRLYVTDSSGSNDPVKQQLEKKPHRVVRLEDTNGDGVFDKGVVFADKLMFPEGSMWHDGSLYVSAAPVIWKLTDTDEDGVADKREEWLDAKTLTGCANDLHGPYVGLDGWIYWCKGAFAKQTYDLPDGKALETRAAHIFRRRPEGGFVEPVMTGGMDNPVEVAFTPEGERIFTTTFFQHPVGGKRDGLVHAIYGGVYGKVHDVIDDHKKTGELLPVLTHLGAAAPCGLIRYESEVFGKEYQDNLFACLFNLHKVTRHQLTPKGATYEPKDSDFLTSDSNDFHPTDVIEDADGSLLVIDTGGWYKLCCPTSQLWKPDLLGAIYRIRRADASKINDPRGLKIAWGNASTEDLAKMLADQRPAVVHRAIQTLRKKSDADQVLGKLLRADSSAAVKRNAIWALTGRTDGTGLLSPSSASVRVALKDANASVRHTAIHSVSVAKDKDAEPELLSLLKDSDPQVRRAAAEALGRVGSAETVPVLLTAAGSLTSAAGSSIPDRVQEHSIIYALIEIDAPSATRQGLESENHFTKRAALIALDQMDNGKLDAKTVAPLLSSADPVLKETANWIVSHRRAWGGDLAEFFAAKLNDKNLSEPEARELERQLATLAAAEPIQELLVKSAADEKLPSANRLVALHAMAQAHPKETPASWTELIARLAGHGEGDLAGPAVAAASSFSFKRLPEDLKTALFTAAHNERLSEDTRLQALAVASPGAELDDTLFRFVRENLTSEKSLSIRNSASAILTKAKLNQEQSLALCENIKMAGPLELSHLLGAFENSTSELVGTTLISSLKESRGLSGLHPDRIKQTLAKYPEPVKEQGRAVAAMLDEDLAKQATHLDALLPRIKGGDIRRGQALFNSQKAACASCHQIGYLGGNLGPDLTRIGQVRTERDLLEAIVYPSASFVRSFEPVIVRTKGGDEYSGVLRKDAVDEVVLGTGPGADVRIARNDVEETRPGKISVMPQGFAEQLRQDELADLIAFLEANR